MRLYTIGFTKTTAENFFDRLERAGVKRLLDVRLHRDSQLSGFARERDLPFFLGRLVSARYEVAEVLAPTPELLSAYRSKAIDWDEYASGYKRLLVERSVESQTVLEGLSGSCLLCSEAKPEKCHRRLAAKLLGPPRVNA